MLTFHLSDLVLHLWGRRSAKSLGMLLRIRAICLARHFYGVTILHTLTQKLPLHLSRPTIPHCFKFYQLGRKYARFGNKNYAQPWFRKGPICNEEASEMPPNSYQRAFCNPFFFQCPQWSRNSILTWSGIKCLYRIIWSFCMFFSQLSLTLCCRMQYVEQNRLWFKGDWIMLTLPSLEGWGWVNFGIVAFWLGPRKSLQSSLST